MQMTKPDQRRLAELTEALLAGEGATEDAIAAAQAGKGDVAGANAAVDAYNETLRQLAELRDGWVSEIMSLMEEKSERWQESATGQAHQTMMDQWEELDLEEVEHFDPDTKVEDLDFDTPRSDEVSAMSVDHRDFM